MGASYIYIPTLSAFVLIRVEMRDREINMGGNKVVCRHGENIGLGTGDLDLSHLKWC